MEAPAMRQFENYKKKHHSDLKAINTEESR